jgi:hypothetical protein
MKASQLESMKQIQEEIESERQICKKLIDEKEEVCNFTRLKFFLF